MLWVEREGALLGIMDDPRGFLCTQRELKRGLEIPKGNMFVFRKSWDEFRSFIIKNIKTNKQYR